MPAPSTLSSPPVLDDAPEWADGIRLGLTPEQAGVMDLLEGKVLRAPLPLATGGNLAGMQRDALLAVTGGVCLVAGLVSIFFMAALGAVLLTVGALFCVAAYEHAVSVDSAAVLLKAQQDHDGNIDSAAQADAFADMHAHSRSDAHGSQTLV